jgi:Ser/Thr protein kinase RdoA (MazF antagonist)
VKDIVCTPATGPSWKTLKQWGDDVTRIERLTGGVANDVWSVRVNGRLAVARLGTRSDADLAWETELLQYLDGEGLTVPLPIPTTAGRLFAEGLVVMTYVKGEPPESQADWRRVADTLAPVDAGLVAAPGLAIIDRPLASRDRNEDRPPRDAA